MMKRVIRTTMVVAAAAVMAPLVEAGPKIQFDRTVYDFGKTSLVQSVTGTFTFTNVGDAELVLQKPSVTCGCTVAGVKPDRLAPGEKGELVFNLNIANVRGHAQKFINVPSNDPDNPNVRLTIQVDVAQTFELSPGFVNFGLLRVGESTNATVTVRRVDGQPLTLVKAESANPDLRAEVKAIDEKSGQVEIQFTAAGAARRVAELVQVYTADSGASPAASIQVAGQLVGDLVVQPERLIWGIGNFDRLPASQLERALTRSVRVSLTKPADQLQLTQVNSTLKDLQVEVIPLENGRTYMVQARFPHIPQASTSGTITIETNLKDQPTLEIPVSVNVLRR